MIQVSSISTLALAFALAPPTAALAQEVQSEVATDSDAAAGARVYTLADLEQYAPQTALDMVSRIPGFSIEGGNQGNRGLGQASQNVLLNGQRVSGKSNDAFDTLRRISADKVVRIEIIDGATLDVPGLTGEVANVVYEAGGISGTWRYDAQFRRRVDNTLLNAGASLSGGGSQDSWSLSVQSGQRRQGNFGPEQRFAPDGGLLVTRDEIGTFYGDRPRLSGNYARSFSNGHLLNLNAAGGLGIQRNTVRGTVLLADGTRFEELFEGGEDEWEVELGGDYSLGLGGGRLKMIGLQRNEHSPTFDEFGTVGGDVVRFDRTIDENESILRSEFGWQAGATDWEFSTEGAYNSLTSEAFLLERPVDAPETRTDFPDNRIEEYRGEAILSFSRPLSPTLSLQVNGGAEYSRIQADAGDPQGYFNPKGSAVLNWRANDDLTFDLRLERVVEQLNFFDFLATVDLQDDRDRGRNDAIQPPTRWRARIEAVAKLGDYGSVTPFATAQRIEGLIEAIPISPTEEALGNAGDATAWGIGAEGTLLFDPLGVRGARLDFNTVLADSSFVDPLLGITRARNGQTFSRINLNFRHDIPGSDLAYGGSFSTEDEEGRFRLDQFANRYRSGPMTDIFIEHKDVLGIQATAGIVNLLGTSDVFERVVFADRRDGPVAFREFQDREFGRILFVNLSGQI